MSRAPFTDRPPPLLALTDMYIAVFRAISKGPDCRSGL